MMDEEEDESMQLIMSYDCAAPGKHSYTDNF